MKIQKKSDSTKETYSDVLEQFKRTHFIDTWEAMLEGTTIELEERIRNYLPTKKHSMANKTYWALRKFYGANKIILDWDDLLDYIPKKKKVYNYRARTKAEIESMLRIAKPREQLAVLCMSSGGVRIAGLPTLLIENGTWIDKYKLYCFLVYPGTDDEYQALFSPQTSTLMRKIIGKRVDGPVFLTKFGAGWAADEGTLEQAIRRLAKKAGVYFPYEVQVDHGFRHFFRTNLEISKIHDNFAERLMGHKKEKLKKTYSHPDPLELLEASEYYKAIPNLTFEM